MIALNPYFEPKLPLLYELCEKIGVEELYFFGSSIDGRFDLTKSDLDVLVTFCDGKIANIVQLKRGLNRIYGVSIDVFCPQWIVHPEMQDYLSVNKLLLFHRRQFDSLK